MLADGGTFNGTKKLRDKPRSFFVCSTIAPLLSVVNAYFDRQAGHKTPSIRISDNGSERLLVERRPFGSLESRVPMTLP